MSTDRALIFPTMVSPGMDKWSTVDIPKPQFKVSQEPITPNGKAHDFYKTTFKCFCGSEITHEGAIPADVPCKACGRRWDVGRTSVSLVGGSD